MNSIWDVPISVGEAHCLSGGGAWYGSRGCKGVAQSAAGGVTRASDAAAHESTRRRAFVMWKSARAACEERR